MQEAETFESDPVRGELAPRPAKAELQPEPSVAWDPETETRSVHREHAGRVLSPETKVIEEADVVVMAEGNTLGLKARLFPRAPPGS